jgi:hypothetical protein
MLGLNPGIGPTLSVASTQLYFTNLILVMLVCGKHSTVFYQSNPSHAVYYFHHIQIVT